MDGVLQESREGLVLLCAVTINIPPTKATPARRTNHYSTPALAVPATEPRHLCIAFAGRPRRLLRAGNARTASADSLRNQCVPTWDNDPAEKILLILWALLQIRDKRTGRTCFGCARSRSCGQHLFFDLLQGHPFQGANDRCLVCTCR